MKHAFIVHTFIRSRYVSRYVRERHLPRFGQHSDGSGGAHARVPLSSVPLGGAQHAQGFIRVR